ncbi:histidine phosphatase superfamily [Biscogniauxia marginata]|nr:histidine phosphatase superfamily [Biscogniauxia marginata]
MASYSLNALLALTFVSGSLGQSGTETVWASFAYVLHGERTPPLGETSVILTPSGAQQLYSQGSLFRARYLSNTLSDEEHRITTNSPIVGLEQDTLDNSQLSIYSSTDDVVTASTLAFMQGLYPPVSGTSASSNASSDASTLANGTTVEYPLDGYQYPNIQTLSGLDPNSIWLDGHSACSEYWSSGNDFRDEAYSVQMYNSSLDFYQETWSEVFPDTLSASTVNFDRAYDLYEYALYEYNHNQSVRDSLNDARLARLRNLADAQQFALNGDLSASGLQSGDRIRAIAGRMLAGKVVAQLSNQIASGGSSNKLSLAFGSFEPFLAFFSLSGLSDSNNNTVLFKQVPQPGAAMVFELFSTAAGGNDTSDYPGYDELWVRFLYRNGTDLSAPLEEYPLFGLSEARMQWADFRQLVNAFAIKDITGWCQTCDAVTLFCIALDDTPGSDGSTTLFGSGGGSSSLSPAVAGVIGAVIALAVFGVAAAAAFVFGGLRIRRNDGSSRSSGSLGGFKGAEKLASDHDVSIVKSGARHERVGSWELGGPGPSTTGLPSKNDPAFFGAAVQQNRDEDAESIMGRAPIKPLESI